jgi:hypothetical protein
MRDPWTCRCGHEFAFTGIGTRNCQQVPHACPLDDERESVADIHEQAEQADQWWHAGPDRLAEDVTADKLGRKLAVELGGL